MDFTNLGFGGSFLRHLSTELKRHVSVCHCFDIPLKLSGMFKFESQHQRLRTMTTTMTGE